MNFTRRFLLVAAAALVVSAIPVGGAVAAELEDVLDEANVST